MALRKILTRTILLVSFVSLFTDIASEMLYPIMPVYLRSIGFSFVLIGILEGVAEATAGLSKGYFGNLSDKLKKRAPFVQAGYTLSAISKPMMAILTFPWWIFIARTFDRLGKGIRTGARDAILSDETLPENKGKIFGFHRGMDTLGAAIGPFVALIFLMFYPGQYKWLFLIAFFPGLIAIALTFLLKDKKAAEEQTNLTNNKKERVSFFSYLTYWKRATPAYHYLVIGLLVFTLFNSSDAFLLLALKNKHMTDSAMIGYYIFYNLVYAMLSYPIGYMADKIGLKTTMITGLLIFSVVYILFGFTSSAVVFAVLFFFYGIYAAATEGVSKALITNMADKSETATAIGFFTSFSSVCTMLASSLAGVLWYSIGPTYMFLISGIGVFFAVVYLFFVLRKK
ncbi:MAG: MFS transporter [Bacteroidota bacterium]|nr:MFS transporter [Bacteroidota bacterium]